MRVRDRIVKDERAYAGREASAPRLADDDANREAVIAEPLLRFVQPELRLVIAQRRYLASFRFENLKQILNSKTLVRLKAA
jgi:hypothetical protein